MNPNELLKKIIEAGADEVGINDRFGGNVELYESCFDDFMSEPNFIVLRDAVHTKSYDKAFDAAHAIKGLSGNLGITDFYEAIKALTDFIRNGQYDQVEQAYDEVERQHERLKDLVLNEQPDTSTPAQDNGKAAKAVKTGKPSILEKLTNRNNKVLVSLFGVMVVVMLILAASLINLNITHKENVSKESGQHLSEISAQIRLYIENNIDSDWRIARSVGDSILSGAYENKDSAVLTLLQRKRVVWGVSDLMLYTENGLCIYANGDSEHTDVATQTVYNARKHGKWLSVLDSNLIYTVPLHTNMTFKGSQITAVSVVRDMSSFLDGMDFSSFDGMAWMYLTDENGILVSALTSPWSTQAFNIQSIIGQKTITPLNEADSEQDFFTSTSVKAFLLSDRSGDVYAISSPITTGLEDMRLFYFVPAASVNDVMGGFASQLLQLSIVIMAIFGLCILMTFFFMYKNRAKRFDEAMAIRERMFDLLVKNTKTAFGLFRVDEEKAEYISSNLLDVIGSSDFNVVHQGEGFAIRNISNVETENLALINAKLSQWDGKRMFRTDYLCNRKNATPTYFVVELYPIDSEKDHFLFIAQDVTTLYAREAVTKEAMEAANRANAAKTDFLSRMSHDIRTPMNAIMNMSDFAMESMGNSKALYEYLTIINDSSKHLLHLINDVLDMSRIETGQVVIANAPFNLRKELEVQADITRPLCQEKNQVFITDLRALNNVNVCGDATKLSQIVGNLLSNAVKFTPEKGAVRLTARELPSLRESMVTVSITVEDNGMGIGEVDMGSIFEPFSRSSDSSIENIQGTGLGLAIVKNYVDAMGGTVQCQSQKGEGSKFIVELFFEKNVEIRMTDEPADDPTDFAFTGMHALVAEDNHTNQLIAKQMLERMGFILDFAADGDEAFRMFSRSKQGTYDVIYMDIQMPVMNGYEATEHIRACDHPQAKTIPIIAMTANAFLEDIEKARAVGMDGHVDKPIVSYKLAEQTEKAFKAKTGGVI